MVPGDHHGEKGQARVIAGWRRRQDPDDIAHKTTGAGRRGVPTRPRASSESRWTS